MILNFIIVILALLAPTLPGIFILTWINPHIRKYKHLWLISSLLIGHSALTSLMYIAYLAFGRVNTGISLLIFFILSISTYYLCWRKTDILPFEKPKDENFLKLITLSLKIIIIATILIVTIVALSQKIHDMPGFAVWGLKAKMIFISQSCYQTITSNEIYFSHREYPLGYPLSLVWCSQMINTWDDYALKIVPLFWGLISLISLFNVSKIINGKFIAICLCAFFVTNDTFMNCTQRMYAEMILLPFVIIGFLCFYKFNQATDKNEKQHWLILSLILLIFSAWYKIEGLLYLGILVFTSIIFYWSKIKETLKSTNYKGLYLATTTFAIAILPWSITRYIFELSSGDFELKLLSFDKTHTETINQAFIKYFLNPKYGGMICLGFVLFLILRSFYHKRLYILWNMVICGLLSIAIFYLAFYASATNLGWHIKSITRILLIPELLICVGLLPLIKTDHDIR